MLNRITASLIAALALSACGTADDLGDGQPESTLKQAQTVAVGDFVVDSHLLDTQTPSGKLPAHPLPAEAFDIETLTTRLGGFDETLKDRGSFATRISLGSPNWTVEVDQTRGIATVHARQVKKGVAHLAPEVYRDRSMARLARWGIDSDSVARVLQRQLMKQARTVDGDVKAPVVHRHKTYAYRGVGGIQVEGHRAVITHHADGSFHRASVAWPPLAASGHRLTTELDTQAVTERALERLRAEGEKAGRLTLRWGYVPTVHANGETTLELKAIARLIGVPHEDHGTEDRVFEIAVDAR